MNSDIVTYPLNGITYTAEEAAGYHSARTSGVYCLDEDFKVSLSGSGRSVQISPGRAWVHPSRFTGYSIIMQAPVTLALSVPNPVATRTDCVVLRFDQNARRSYLTVLNGVMITLAEDYCRRDEIEAAYLRPMSGRGPLPNALSQGYTTHRHPER